MLGCRPGTVLLTEKRNRALDHHEQKVKGADASVPHRSVAKHKYPWYRAKSAVTPKDAAALRKVWPM